MGKAGKIGEQLRATNITACCLFPQVLIVPPISLPDHDALGMANLSGSIALTSAHPKNSTLA